MLVRLPRAEWVKHVVRIEPGATSGWDWIGPDDNPSGFIGGQRGRQAVTELEAGDVVVTHKETAQAVKDQCAVYVILDGPVLYRHGYQPAAQSWSASLAPYVDGLLKMPRAARCAWSLHRYLEQIDISRIPPTQLIVDGGVMGNFQTHLTSLRQLYISRMSESGDAGYEEYLRISAEAWISLQAQICGVEPSVIREFIANTPLRTPQRRVTRTQPTTLPTPPRRLSVRSNRS